MGGFINDAIKATFGSTPLEVVGTAIGALSRMPQAVQSAAGQVGLRYAATGGKLTKGMLLWVNPNTNRFQRFLFPMNPESLKDVMTPNWAKAEVPGQERPLYQFVSGGERELSFALHFFYEDRDRTVIRDYIATLQQLTKRQVASTTAASNSPPPVYFYFGEYFRGLRCLVTKIEVESYDLFDPALLLPLRATVNVSLVEAPDTTGEKAPNVSFSGSLGGLGAIVKATGVL